MSIASQDVYLNLMTPTSVIGSGGGGAVPSNLVVSTLSAFGLSNISSINGVAYTGSGAVPANLVVSSITNAGTMSTTGAATFGNVINVAPTFGVNLGFCGITGGVSGSTMSISAPLADSKLNLVCQSTIMSASASQPCQVSINGNLGVSSINGTSWTYITSTLAGLSPP